MEPDIMPSHSSPPPPIENGDVEEEPEEEVSPSSIRQPPPAVQPATRHHNCSSTHPMKPPQPSAAATLGPGSCQITIERRDCMKSCEPSTNGYAERRHTWVAVSAYGGETAFADFAVFAEQPEHPWCCGFSALDGPRKWAGREAGSKTSSRLGERIYDPGHEHITELAPRTLCASKAKESVCTTVNHCEEIDAASGLPARPQLKSSENEVREDEESDARTADRTVSVYESASEDLVSYYQDLSFDGPSEDLEPNVSSLASEGPTDWDQTDDEEEELGVGEENLSHGVHYRHRSATQETSATSNQSLPDAADNAADFKGLSLEPDADRIQARTAGAGVPGLRTLPPSDSFADFCSATQMQVDGEASWAEFTDQQTRQGGQTGTLSGDQTSFSCRVQQLLLASFPEVEVPAAEWEEQALSRTALQEMPEWIQRAVWQPHQDLHSATALQFQWGGSHTNVTLLRCLGVATKNTGMLETTKNCVPAVGSPGHAVITAQASPGLCDLDSMQEVLPSSPLDWSNRGLSSSQDGMSPRRAPSFWGRK